MKREFDEDFWVEFCPVCGSDDITCFGFDDRLHDKTGFDAQCNNCDWEYIIVLINDGKKQFKFRKDMKDCEICKVERKEQEEMEVKHED